MAFDFEALVGHVYVVGGRSLSTQPPGMLVEVAPKKTARGRELDTIFVLTSPSGEGTAPAAFYDEMAIQIAERYFNSTGSVTAGLRAAITAINEALVEHNNSGKRRYEANLLCAVLKDTELFLSRVGAGVAVYLHNSELLQFPTEFANEVALFGTPLGVQSVPDIKMAKYAVTQSSRLLMGDNRLVDLDYERLNNILRAAQITDVIAGVKEMTVTSLSAMAVEFVPPEMPSPDAVKDTRTSSRVPLPSAEPLPNTGASELPAHQSPKRSRESESVMSARFKILIGTATLFIARLLSSFNRILDRILPPPPEGKTSWFRTSTAAVIAILVPVVVVGMVLMLGLGQIDKSGFELCFTEANKTADVARSINTSDRNGVLQGWNAVLSKIDECEDMRSGDPVLAGLTREAQTVKDGLFQVTRRAATLIQAFPNAELTRMVLHGVDLYVLDSQNQLVYRISLTGDGRTAAGNSQPVPAMRFGSVVGQYRVDKLIDIAWSDDATQIVALDKSGLLIECSPRFLQDCQVQKLLRAESWINPIKMTFWQGRLYLLDPGANQVWRYDSTGGSFSSSPIEYFAGDSRPQIQNAVGFGITEDSGVVHIIGADGLITKWNSGKQVGFTYAGFPEGQQLTSANSLFLNSDPIGQALDIADRTTRTIYETTLSGSWIASYQVFKEDDFARLNNAVGDANQQVIYALSGNSVFVIEKQVP
ncbi:MAG: hypothetical protein R3E39_04660 [Anaerolineae bacterium]